MRKLNVGVIGLGVGRQHALAYRSSGMVDDIYLCDVDQNKCRSGAKEIDAAALIYIATLFVRNITDIEWEDAAEAGPAVLAMIAMPFPYSISNGIALAFISYAAIKLFTGKFSRTSPHLWVIVVLSLISLYVA